MKKIRTATLIYLPRGNHAKCPIYEHEGKFYIKANKPNTSVYNPMFYNKREYSPVISIKCSSTDAEQWFLDD